ncbi:hypothetical protein PHYSODRAFT_313861 [Phytophthora sojae]|uniref:Integrase zinc-binding domain-containing protein n=1 Tax=Phytophthora sojae (strain P6497) TaxID=1094619 RepID=G4Z7T1_PHYSP|nr:hypothetical protein PHYSODRAFT_313861 [Phytophthora sojae]EGZ21834.1 hypothetical protein PHYSODRAFT_313861 [Phytophthora sojae]|eukprot:XP_009524551.1 hypothetical protein PHYSODRAFT_313861 [Phytophthora sojae]
MLHTIAQVFYWRGMEADVHKLVDNCIVCLKAKHPTTRFGKLPPKSVEVRPWFEIAVDSIGPMEAAYLMDRYWFARYPRPARCIHDGGTNAVIERVHRVIGEKMRTKDIQTQEDWANFLNNTMLALRASNHSMLKASSVQLAFGRDMLVDVAHATDWTAEHRRKVEQVRAHNERENQGRAKWTYRPGDHVLLHRDAGVQGKMQPLFDGPFEVIAVQEHGTLTLDKGRYLEKVHIRRVRPCKGKRGGDCEQPQ